MQHRTVRASACSACGSKCSSSLCEISPRDKSRNESSWAARPSNASPWRNPCVVEEDFLAVNGLKCRSCRFWQRTDLPPGSNMHGLNCGPCRFWQRTDLPPGSNMLRLAYADSGSACKLAQDMVPTAHTRNDVRFRVCFLRAFVCVPSRWKVLSGEFRRRPTSLAIKFHKPDRVGRRGLSEPREDFSRLNTYVFPWLHPSFHPSLIWGLF